MIEYPIAAVTMAKITMQMTIVNQITKSMRVASLEAWTGSHVGSTATAVAIPPATTPMPTSSRICPLRIRQGA